MSVPSASEWRDIVKLINGEHSLRDGRPLPDGASAYMNAQQTVFADAWQHVSAIENPDAVVEDYANFLTSDGLVSFRKSLDALKMEVSQLVAVHQSLQARQKFADATKAIETVLIALLGHGHPLARRRAVRLLNCLYAGTTWEREGFLAPMVACVGDSFTVRARTCYSLGSSGDKSEKFYFLVCAPSFDARSRVSNVLTVHAPTEQEEVEIDQTSEQLEPLAVDEAGGTASSKGDAGTDEASDGTELSLRLNEFPRAGFYDWRLVVIGESGEARPVAVAPGDPLVDRHETAHRATAAAVAQGSPGGVSGRVLTSIARIKAQGRYIVQPADARNAKATHISVDLEGTVVDKATGRVAKHGTFSSVASRVPQMAREGANLLVVHGAIERDCGWGESEQADNMARAMLESAAPSPSPSPDGAARGRGGSSASGNGQGDDDQSVRSEESALAAVSAAGPSDDGPVTNPREAVQRLGLAPTGQPSSGAAGDVASGQLGTTLQSPEPKKRHASTGTGKLYESLLGGTDASESMQVADAWAHALDELKSREGDRRIAARPDASPYAVMCRSTLSSMHGGLAGVRRLVSQAEEAGVRVALQVDASIGSSRPHRNHKGKFAHTLDESGLRTVLRGCDGCVNQWEDRALPNFRRGDVWQQLVDDCVNLADASGVRSLYLHEASSYPFIMQMDSTEMFRRDTTDLAPHYTPVEILWGDVVVGNQEGSYWVDAGIPDRYANPILVKLTRAMWERYPDFCVLGESFYGRDGPLLHSGVIPHSIRTIEAMAFAASRGLEPSGRGFYQPVPPGEEPVGELKSVLEREEDTCPPGGQQLILRSLATPRTPYPSLLLGRFLWTAVDLLSCLPGGLMEYQDEKRGRSFRLDFGGTYKSNEAFSKQAKGALEARQRRARALARGAAGAGDAAAAVQGSAGVMLASSKKPLLDAPAGMGDVAPMDLDALMSRAQAGAVSARHARPLLVASPHIGPANPGTYPGHAGVGGVVPPQGPGGEQQQRAAAAQMAEHSARRAVMARMNMLPKKNPPPLPAVDGSSTTESTDGGASSGSGMDSFTLGKSRLSVASSSTPALAEIFANASRAAPSGHRQQQQQQRQQFADSRVADDHDGWGLGAVADEGFGLSAAAPGARSAQPPTPGMPPIGDPGMAGSHTGASALLGRVPGVLSHVDLAALDMTSKTRIDAAAAAATSDAQRAGVQQTTMLSGGSDAGAAHSGGFDDSQASGLPDDILSSAMDSASLIPVGSLPGTALSQARELASQPASDWYDGDEAEDEGIATAAMQLALRRDKGAAIDPEPGSDVSGWRSNALNWLEKPPAHSFASDAMQIENVRSWRPAGIVAVKGLGGPGDGDADAGSGYEAVRRMPEMEAKYKKEVGPEVGFDLDRIGAHYNHRAAVRARHPALTHGDIVPLRALHRYGVHSHVLAFARPLIDRGSGRSKSMAVVACNFNHAPSTFHVRCSRVAPLIGAASSSGGSQARGLSRRPTPTAMSGSGSFTSAGASMMDPATGLDDAFGVFGLDAPRSPENDEIPYAPRGGVWEVRDAFAGKVTPKHGSDVLGPHEAHDSGPLIALLTSNETAFAPMNTTLQPYASVCWLFTQQESRGMAPARTLANVQWLFASALQRLQGILRLKEAGTSSLASTAGVSEQARILLSGGDASQPDGRTRWTPPWEILNDKEIWAAARNNVVGSLCRLVAVSTARFYYLAVRQALAALPREVALTGCSEEEGGDGAKHKDQDPAVKAMKTKAISGARRKAIRFCSRQLRSALRVVCFHWGLKPAAAAGELHAAHLAPFDDASAGSGSGQIDVGAATACVRAALYLACEEEAWASVESFAKAAVPGSESADPSEAAIDLEAARQVRGAARGKDGLGKGRLLDPSLLTSSITRVSKGRGFQRDTETPDDSKLGETSSSQATTMSQLDESVSRFCMRLGRSNKVGSIIFLTPELGKWSTVGGLGVMVDELTIGLAALGVDVHVISPFYNVNRKGKGDYLRPDGILYSGSNVVVQVGAERVEMGVHSGEINGVKLHFLHHSTIFPRPYPPNDAAGQIRVLSAYARGCLQLMCDNGIRPDVVVTNDWFTALAPAYARQGFYGPFFDGTDFIHIAHNLDSSYEGRLYPQPDQGACGWIHELPEHLLVDNTWADVVVNPTRCALLSSDSWATVSRSYRADLLSGSAVRHLLRLAPQPFAHPNGIPVALREKRLVKLPVSLHNDAKAILQRKYFNMSRPDPSIPMFGFVGRITLQKGIHLALNAADALIQQYKGRIQFLVGGMASSTDTYGMACAAKMRALAARHPNCFWADPTAFFTDGDLVNLGCDFCMMPSLFEPGGIVQQEFFVAGTPVIAFKTGGLKDTVIDFDPEAGTGSGFTFESHTPHDFMQAVRRAINVFRSPGMYDALRQSARASVMDLSVVSCAWHAEFHRLRRVTVAPTAVSASMDAADGHPDPLGKMGEESGAAGGGAGAAQRAPPADGCSRDGTVVVGRLAAASERNLTIGGRAVAAGVGASAAEARSQEAALVEFWLPAASASGATSVEVTGSFLDWSSRVKLHKGTWRSGSVRQLVLAGSSGAAVPGGAGARGPGTAEDGFSGLAKVACGTHQYKFVLDGKDWIVDPGAPCATDAAGNVNNELTVSPMDRSERQSHEAQRLAHKETSMLSGASAAAGEESDAGDEEDDLMD